MTRMCIYDDDKEFSLMFKAVLLEHAEKYNKKITVDIFLDGSNAVEQINKRKYDIVFLDIELGEKKGFEIGNAIREELKNEKIQIVYISGDTEYAMELFDSRPFDFIVKPIKKAAVYKMLDNYFRIYSEKDKYLHYRWLKQDYAIRQDDIMYMQSRGRKIIAKTTDGEIEFYDKISQVIERLDTNNFCQLHKSYIINSIYVKKYMSDKVIMCDGIEIPISKLYKKNFQDWMINSVL